MTLLLGHRRLGWHHPLQAATFFPFREIGLDGLDAPCAQHDGAEHGDPLLGLLTARLADLLLGGQILGDHRHRGVVHDDGVEAVLNPGDGVDRLVVAGLGRGLGGLHLGEVRGRLAVLGVHRPGDAAQDEDERDQGIQNACTLNSFPAGGPETRWSGPGRLA
jgi:hypothetical protein